jgi:cobalt/nickel transport system permease protein
MHASLFDQYQDRDSLIHALDPRVKAVVTLLFILSSVLLPDGAWPAFLLTWLLLLALNRLAQIPYSYTLKRSLVALPFGLAAVTVVFTLPGQPAFSLALGAWRLQATDAGLVRFGSIMLRSWLSIQAAIWLTGATAFPDLVHALRHLRAPRTLVAVIAFMYRYAFVLSDEALRLLRAREARSAHPPGRSAGGSLAWRARVAGGMAGQLFLRSYERSDRVYQAMLARGYRGEFLTLNPHEIRTPDLVFGVLTAALLLALQAFARLTWY